MTRDLLSLELMLKAVIGAVLLLFPRSMARAFGLPAVAETFWPRLLGGMLIGLAVATLLESRLAASSGLGLAGHVALNLVAALTLLGLLIMGKAGASRKGRAVAGLAAIALTVLALVEMAWV